MAQYVLEAQNITKDFIAVRALNNVSMSVKNGEILGLIGENGAGKSTILKVINGVYVSGTFEGKILVNGEEVHLHSPHDALLKGIGFSAGNRRNIIVCKSFTRGINNVFFGKFLSNFVANSVD